MPDAAGLLELALDARRRGDSAAARALLSDAVAQCRVSGPTRLLAQVLKASGQIESDLGSGLALGYYEEAAAIYRTLGDTDRTAHTIRHVADVHRREGRAAAADPIYREALALYRAEPETSPLDLANAIRGLALVAPRDEALRLWEEAGRLYQSAGVDAGVQEAASRRKELAEA